MLYLVLVTCHVMLRHVNTLLNCGASLQHTIPLCRHTCLHLALRNSDRQALSSTAAWLAFRQVLTGVSEQEYRIQFALEQPPFSLLVLADSRHSHEIKDAAVVSFVSKRKCCLKTYDSQPVKRLAEILAHRHGVDLNTSFHRLMPPLLADIADELDCNNADCENQHAADRNEHAVGALIYCYPPPMNPLGCNMLYINMLFN
jgi:hypothetical protein